MVNGRMARQKEGCGEIKGVHIKQIGAYLEVDRPQIGTFHSETYVLITTY